MKEQKIDTKRLMAWDELPVGAVINVPGSSEDYHTGGWRTFKPVFHAEKCINCLFCYVYCPDEAVLVDENNKMIGFDYDHCKGCGICSQVCPDKASAISMELERKSE